MKQYSVLGLRAKARGPVKKPFVSLPSPETEGRWVVIKRIDETAKEKGKR